MDAAVAAGIAPSRIVIGGHSQGGALALATTLHAKFPVAGCVMLSGWALPSQNLAELMKSSAAASGGTEFLVVHGDQDSTVLPECGDHVAKLLQDGGCPVEHKVVEGMGHSTRGTMSEEVSMLVEFLVNNLPREVD